MTSGCSSSRQATRSTSPATSPLYLAYISPTPRLYLPQASNEEYLPCQQRLYCHGREIPADLDIATLGEVGILPQSPYSLSCLTSPSRLTSP